MPPTTKVGIPLQRLKVKVLAYGTLASKESFGGAAKVDKGEEFATEKVAKGESDATVENYGKRRIRSYSRCSSRFLCCLSKSRIS